ncbi:MAG: DUF485 domain-containing protein [Acidobacteria bacterium]|nr:DUF485 domain-containing protein [Acidobacteriota bacterium]
MTNEATGVPLGEAQGRHPVTAAEWSAIERDPEFRALVAAKRRFILPATVFFIVYYFALPVLVGYFPGLMSVRVVGKLNLAYLFALSQFFMAWTVMYLYIVKARDFDARAARIVEKVQRGGIS